jgi:hypothetical protein
MLIGAANRLRWPRNLRARLREAGATAGIENIRQSDGQHRDGKQQRQRRVIKVADTEPLVRSSLDETELSIARGMKSQQRDARHCGARLASDDKLFRHPSKQIPLEVRRDLGMPQRELDRRLQVPELAAAIEACAVVAVREHLFIGEQRLDRVGQLQFAARAGFKPAEMLEDLRFQHIAANDTEVRRRNRRFGLLDDAGQLEEIVFPTLAVDHAIGF